jgi:hypothetical protein
VTSRPVLKLYSPKTNIITKNREDTIMKKKCFDITVVRLERINGKTETYINSNYLDVHKDDPKLAENLSHLYKKWLTLKDINGHMLVPDMAILSATEDGYCTGTGYPAVIKEA